MRHHAESTLDSFVAVQLLPSWLGCSAEFGSTGGGPVCAGAAVYADTLLSAQPSASTSRAADIGERSAFCAARVKRAAIGNPWSGGKKTYLCAILVRAWDVLGAGLVQRDLPPAHALIDAVDRFIHKQTTFAQKIGTERIERNP